MPSFRGVELLIVSPREPLEWALLGPHCQCSSRQPGRNPQTIAIKWRGKRRRFRVPHWVGIPGVVPAATARDRHTPIRFAERKRVDLPSLGRRADLGRLRPIIRPPAASRCIVPWSLLAAFDDVDAAVSSALRFVSEVAKQHAALFGGEGESAGMRRAVDAMAVCFDWEHLVARTPTAEQVREFGTLARMLMPYLVHTEWPTVDQFPNVTHEWPSVDSLQIQYAVLCSRLRCVRRPPWWSANSVFGPQLRETQLPCLPVGLPEAAVGALRRALTGRIAMVLSSFLRPRSARGPFYVSYGDWLSLGTGGAVRSSRARCGRQCCRLGGAGCTAPCLGGSWH